MRLLLDHCIPARFGRLLVGHDVSTAKDMGWADIGNGRLLAAAAGKFNALITVDRGFAHQHNPATMPMAVVLVEARNNRMETLVGTVPAVLAVLNETLPPGVYHVGRQK